jgi:hypothetical protein
MCLIQFAMLYTLLGPRESKKFKEKYKLDKDYLFLPDKKDKKRQILAVCNYKENNPPKENMTLILPDFVILKNKKVMRLRSYEAVIRRYKFRRENNPHEYFYSELLMFRPWFSESELFEDDIDKCKEWFEEMDTDMNKEQLELTKIDTVKRTLFPHLVDVEEGREMVEKYDFDKSVIGNEIDSKGEQQCEDEEDIGWEEAEEYAGLQPDDLLNCEEEKLGPALPDKAYQVPDVIDMAELLEVTRQLVSEQKVALNIIIAYCKGLRKSLLFPPKPPLLIVHGGAGTGKSTLISVISKWVHKLLQLP